MYKNQYGAIGSRNIVYTKLGALLFTKSEAIIFITTVIIENKTYGIPNAKKISL